MVLATSGKERAEIRRKWNKMKRVVTAVAKQTGRAIDKTADAAYRVTGWAERVAPEANALALGTENPVAYGVALGIDTIAAAHEVTKLIKHTKDVLKGKKDHVTMPALETTKGYQQYQLALTEQGDTLNMIDMPPSEDLPTPSIIEGPRYLPWPEVVQQNKRQKTGAAVVMDVD